MKTLALVPVSATAVIAVLLLSAVPDVSSAGTPAPAREQATKEAEGTQAATRGLLPILPGLYDGFGMNTPAGSGRHAHLAGYAKSRVIKVTTLEPEGPGSFYEAIRAEGPRTVVFEIGGVIDFRPYKGILINNGHLTVAGATAPGKGIAIYGAQLIVNADHVHFDNIRIRTGDLFDVDAEFWYPGTENHRTGRWTQFSERDTLKVKGNDVVFSNCSFSWGTDELVNTRGSRLSFYRCLFAEPIASPKHHKGMHPKGMIIQCMNEGEGQDVAIVQSAFLKTYGRNPCLNPGTSAYLADNYIRNSKFGLEVCHGAPDKDKRGPDDTGAVVLTLERQVYENVFKGPLRLLLGAPATNILYIRDIMIEGTLHPSPWDDLHLDRVRTTWGGKKEVDYGKYRTTEKPVRMAHYQGLDVHNVKDRVLDTAGAFPANRDPVDARLIANADKQLAHWTGKSYDMEIPHSVDGAIHPKEMEFLNKSPEAVEKLRSNTVEGGWAELPVVVRKLKIPDDPFEITDSGYTRLEQWLHTFPHTDDKADTCP